MAVICNNMSSRNDLLKAKNLGGRQFLHLPGRFLLPAVRSHLPTEGISNPTKQAKATNHWILLSLTMYDGHVAMPYGVNVDKAPVLTAMRTVMRGMMCGSFPDV